jgi:hypothetical protein
MSLNKHLLEYDLKKSGLCSGWQCQENSSIYLRQTMDLGPWQGQFYREEENKWDWMWTALWENNIH